MTTNIDVLTALIRRELHGGSNYSAIDALVRRTHPDATDREIAAGYRDVAQLLRLEAEALESSLVLWPDPAGLSNDELAEIERDEHAYGTSRSYREWSDAVTAEYARRGLHLRPSTL
jgi:hypothetical protein